MVHIRQTLLLSIIMALPALGMTQATTKVAAATEKSVKAAFDKALPTVLQSLVLEFYAPEYCFYKQLSTQSLFDLFTTGGYPPVRLLRFNQANTELTAYLDHPLDPVLIDHPDCCKNSHKIVWNVHNGTFTTMSPLYAETMTIHWHHAAMAMMATMGPVIISALTGYNSPPVIIGALTDYNSPEVIQCESADETLRARVINPDQISASIARPHVVTIERDNRFVLQRILKLDQEKQKSAATATAAQNA